MIRLNIKPGDILFIWGNDFISDLIEDLTRGPSHTAICIGNGKLIEAQGFTRVRTNNFSFYSGGKYQIVRLNLPNQIKGLEWLNKQIGRLYDYWDIFVLAIRYLFGFKIPWHEGHRLICSRLSRDFLFACGLNIADENMSPEDLYIWTTNNDGKVVYPEK